MKLAKVCCVLLLIGSVRSDVANLFCDPTDCSASNTNSAYSICTASVLDGNVPEILVSSGAFPNDQAVLDYCLGFCDEGSRPGFLEPGILGAVWDICSGCDNSIVQDVCSICASRPGVGICGTPAAPVCNLVNGDPHGPDASEERIGQTSTPEECAQLVSAHRAAASGMAWSTNDGDLDGRGSCYAEYNPTEITNPGASSYQSCIFEPSESSTTVVLEVQDVSTTPTATQPVVATVGGSGLKLFDFETQNAGMGMGKKEKKVKGMGMGMGDVDLSDADFGKGKGGKKGSYTALNRFQNAASTPMFVASLALLAVGVAGFAYKRHIWRNEDGINTGSPLTENSPLLEGESATYVPETNGVSTPSTPRIAHQKPVLI